MDGGVSEERATGGSCERAARRSQQNEKEGADANDDRAADVTCETPYCIVCASRPLLTEPV